uniref:SCAN box domain-containing protein n=1 Tax=Erpetoichthys calabaricus TaxID=27687 RepID=A0A8C4S663_ERPCA
MYDLLKAEILSHYGVTLDQQASEWRHWRYDPDRPGQAQGIEFWIKMGRWLRPDINQGWQIVEQVACEGFINAMPDYLAQQVRRHPFNDMKSLLDVLERQLAVNRVGGPERTARGSRQGRVATPEPFRRTSEASGKPKERTPVLPHCFKCGEVGQTLPTCLQNVELMDCTWPFSPEWVYLKKSAWTKVHPLLQIHSGRLPSYSVLSI